MKRFASWAADTALHLAFLGGVASAAYGVWLVYHPAGFIAGGLAVSGGAYLLARAR